MRLHWPIPLHFQISSAERTEAISSLAKASKDNLFRIHTQIEPRGFQHSRVTVEHRNLLAELYAKSLQTPMTAIYLDDTPAYSGAL